MSNYKIGLQKAKGGHKIVLYSADNGKLVLAGEVIKNIVDACNVEADLANGWNNKRNELAVELEVFPASKKWPANSGPKKKAAPIKTKRADGTGVTFSGGSGRRKPIQKLVKKK